MIDLKTFDTVKEMNEFAQDNSVRVISVETFQGYRMVQLHFEKKPSNRMANKFRLWYEVPDGMELKIRQKSLVDSHEQKNKTGAGPAQIQKEA